MNTLDKALDEIMKMDYSSREMLSEILSKRIIEEKRNIYASNAKKAKNDFLNGITKAQSAEKAIDQLNSL